MAEIDVAAIRVRAANALSLSRATEATDDDYAYDETGIYAVADGWIDVYGRDTSSLLAYVERQREALRAIYLLHLPARPPYYDRGWVICRYCGGSSDTDLPDQEYHQDVDGAPCLARPLT